MPLLTDIDGLLNDDPKSQLQVFEGADAIKEEIRNMIFYNVGEMIMEPFEGSIFTSLLHEPLTEDNLFVIRNALAQTIKSKLLGQPITNLTIDVTGDDFEEAIYVEVAFTYDSRAVEFTETIAV